MPGTARDPLIFPVRRLRPPLRDSRRRETDEIEKENTNKIKIIKKKNAFFAPGKYGLEAPVLERATHASKRWVSKVIQIGLSSLKRHYRFHQGTPKWGNCLRRGGCYDVLGSYPFSFHARAMLYRERGFGMVASRYPPPARHRDCRTCEQWPGLAQSTSSVLLDMMTLSWL